MDIIINSAFKKILVAAAAREKGKTVFYSAYTFKNAEFLSVVIDKFFKKNKFSYSDVKNIIVFTGPGSYTGIRCAIAYAKAFKAVYKKTVLRGVSLFSAAPYLKKDFSDGEFLMDIRAGKVLLLNSKKRVLKYEEINNSRRYFVFEETRALAAFKTKLIQIKAEHLYSARLSGGKDINAVYLTGPVRCT